jgi:DNA invertase Pin-like site-specific DNA recombinase
MQVRLGTADQNPELQPREIQDYAGRQGWQIVETYPDTISGAKASRPGLNRLMADAMSRKFDCLLISKLDRFGCSLVAFTIATCVSARVASLTRCVPLRPRKHVKPALTRPGNQ